jgi:4-amino-4-deoxy-L-arabinose transferase-like glycosyltransferase
MHDTDPILATKLWWKSRLVSLCALALLVCLGVALRVSALDGVTRRTPDERAYTEAAKVLLVQGRAGIPVLASRVSDPSTTAASPVRAGYLYLLVETMHLTGRSDESVGAALSCTASALSVLLLAVLAWRRFPPAAALTATLLYAVNPAALMTARRAWEEAVAEAVALVLILAASEIQAGSRQRRWAFVIALAGAYAITLKQTPALAFVLCVLWVLIVLLTGRERRNAIHFAILCAVASLAAVGWLTYLAGGWRAFVDLMARSTNSLDGNAYIIDYEEGSPWSLLKALLIVSAPTVLLAVAAVFSLLPWRRPIPVERKVTLALVGMCAVFVILLLGLPHHINLRHLAPVFAPAALLAGVGMAFVLDLRRFAGAEQSGVLAGLAVIALVAMAAVDYRHFRTEFAEPDVQDLSLRMVLAAGDDPLPVNVPAVASVPPEGLARWLALAVQTSQAGDCQGTIDAATHAVQMDANSALAWNDLAAGFECAHQWSSAIDAAQHALKLQPDFQLAKNNLSWSLEQQRKEAVR